MKRFLLRLSRRAIITTLFSKGYNQNSINKIMKALDLRKQGLPDYYKPPPPPKYINNPIKYKNA